MNRQELQSHYAELRRRLQKLHQECETVEVEIRELEREMELSEVHYPTQEDAPDQALVFDELPEKRAGQPR